MSPLDLHIAIPTEADALATLVNSAYRGETSKAGWTTEEHLLGGQRTDADGLREIMARKGSRILIAKVDGVATGCVHMERDGERGWIGMLTVSPTRQNAQLGRKLLRAAEEFLKHEWHCRFAALSVISVREELIAYYERRGYHRTSEKKPFPFDDLRFGEAKRRDFHLAVLTKPL